MKAKVTFWEKREILHEDPDIEDVQEFSTVAHDAVQYLKKNKDTVFIHSIEILKDEECQEQI